MARLKLLELPDDVGLGTVTDLAAGHHGAVRMLFDRPLDVDPGAGDASDFVALARLIADLAASLHAAGVRRDDRVVVLKRESFDVVLLACAVARLGALPVLLSGRLPRDAAAALVERADAPVVVTDEDTATSGALAGVALGRRARVVLSVAGDVAGAVRLDDVRGAPAVPPAPRRGDEPAVVTHTSGTTGVPKLAVHSARGITAQGRAQVHAAARLLRSDDLLAMCRSWVHARSVAGWIALNALGLPEIALCDPDPARVRDLFVRHRPSVVEAYPNVYILWERLASDPAGPFANVKLFFSTFDSAHPRTARRLLRASRRAFPVYVQAYGQTEIGPGTVRVQARWLPSGRSSRSVGRPVRGMTRVRVCDPATGEELPRGRVGAIQVHSRARCLTYLGDDDLAARNRSGEWWSMGDLGYLTRWGTLHFLDRDVDRVEGVDSTQRVEDVLLDRLPDLTEVAIVGLPGRPPQPVVCTYDDVPLDRDAWAAATAGLPPLGEPLQCRWDELPRTATWKLRRPELRRRLEAGELRAAGSPA